jgi:hypothetical protein
MDLTHAREQDIVAWTHSQPVLTRMQVSTITWRARLDNLRFNESELIGLLGATSRIVVVSCNYGRWVWPGWTPKVKPRTTARGRKPKPKPKRERKAQGNGTEFASMIQFWVYGSHVRDVPLLNSDKPHYERELLPPRVDAEGVAHPQEYIRKPYKPKAFRNGEVLIPGGLCDDGRDVREVLEHLSGYLHQAINIDGENGPVELRRFQSEMRNYKLRTLEGMRVDMERLQKHCNREFYDLLNTNWAEIEEFILNPLFDGSMSPKMHGWRFVAEKWYNLEEIPQVNGQEVIRRLQDSRKMKNLLVRSERLVALLNDPGIRLIYRTFLGYVRTSRWVGDASMPEEARVLILRYMLAGRLEAMRHGIERHTDNLMSYYTYNPEKSNAFQIRVKTPTPEKPTKVTMIKIFTSGCINIDGANSRAEADIIYYWLNNLFAEHPELLYREGEYQPLVGDGQDEFSESDEE